MTAVMEDCLLLEACDGHRTEITGDMLLAEFAEVMRERGHYLTAKGLRYPTLAEARRVAAGRRTDRGRNTSPLP